MPAYSFQSITAAQAGAYNGGADSLSFGAATATQINVAYLSNPEQVAISLNGLTVNFGTGVYGDLDLSFSNGGLLFVGGPGADSASGGPAIDALFGGSGNDSLNGGGGGDLLQGNQGADSLSGGAGSDTVYGGADDDLIVLGAATDSSEANWGLGNKGNDTIIASGGADVILGGQGNDLIIGGNGGDYLDGNLGDDVVRGGTGADTILGEGGSDTLSGGGGADIFMFAAGSSEVDVLTSDRILDWAAGDRISLPVHGQQYLEIVIPTEAAPQAPTDPFEYSNYINSLPPATNYFSMALGAADTQMHIAGNNHLSAPLRIVVAQADGDVLVMVDTDGDDHTDLAIILVGARLDQIDFSSFI